MISSDKDPIAAVATAAGRGGVGIVRLSMPAALERAVLDRLFPGRTIEPRRATLLPFTDADGGLLDHAIVLRFPAPASYTGETVLEIQVHGGPVLMKLVLGTVFERCRNLGFRLAEPGEFTKRAFLNGRMDLAQAEAVADLIDAVSETAARAAARSLSGDFSKLVSDAGSGLDELRAYIEAALDFPEEEEDFLAQGRIAERILKVRADLELLLANASQGKVLRDGLTVALVGSPNVGKSSLLNALAGEEVAIVTDVAGTTRDRIEHWIAIDGVPLRIVDTAGVRETDDIVERKGIERALEAVSCADIVLHLVDASGEVGDSSEVLERVMQHTGRGAHLLTVVNKIDKATSDGSSDIDGDIARVSARTGEGLSELRSRLLELAGMTSSSDGLFIARERHLEALRAALAHVKAAEAMIAAGSCMGDLLAEELRLAGRELGGILGETTPDDLLGMIFSKFCIGK